MTTPHEQPEVCPVCARLVDACDCPDCPEGCGVGYPECYALGHLEPAHDSVASFCQHIGVEPLSAALRAIDKDNVEHVWIVLGDGTRLYYHDREALDALPVYVRLAAVGVGGIAWDGSDWEWGTEVPAGNDWVALDRAGEDFHAALDEHANIVLDERFDPTFRIYLNDVFGVTSLDWHNENLSAADVAQAEAEMGPRDEYGRPLGRLEPEGEEK